ncbi:hypothetical protein ACFY8O_34120 [Streptomyces argenteolus]|uniref:Uncharacterized protein n=1 Tax=Streptomyces argenteolus TaxID=67274 RepID=A0ABW6XGN8_9ACTN
MSQQTIAERTLPVPEHVPAGGRAGGGVTDSAGSGTCGRAGAPVETVARHGARAAAGDRTGENSA